MTATDNLPPLQELAAYLRRIKEQPAAVLASSDPVMQAHVAQVDGWIAAIAALAAQPSRELANLSRDDAIRVWHKHCDAFRRTLGHTPSSAVIDAMMEFSTNAAPPAPAPTAQDAGAAWVVTGPDGSRFEGATPFKAASLANRHRVEVDPVAATQFADAIADIQRENEAENERLLALHGSLNCPACGGSGHVGDITTPSPASAPAVEAAVWSADGMNHGMRFPDESDISGGATDCTRPASPAPAQGAGGAEVENERAAKKLVKLGYRYQAGSWGFVGTDSERRKHLGTIITRLADLTKLEAYAVKGQGEREFIGRDPVMSAVQAISSASYALHAAPAPEHVKAEAFDVRDWIEKAELAHDISLDGEHSSARSALRDLIDSMTEAATQPRPSDADVRDAGRGGVEGTGLTPEQFAQYVQQRRDFEASHEVLLEHSGCGRGSQWDSLQVKLNPGDKVVMVKGAISRAMAATPPAAQGEQDGKGVV